MRERALRENFSGMIAAVHIALPGPNKQQHAGGD